jgi:sugar phosphate isomerase/epimerase
MKFAVCHEMFEGWDWPRQCKFIADVGYDGIEVAPFMLAPRITDVSTEQRRTLRQQAEDAGIKVIGLHWLLAKTQGLHLTTADSAVRRATAEYVIELGRACADLGGDVLVFGSPLQRNIEPGMSLERAREHAVEVFRAAMPALAERNVRLCLEPLTMSDTNFINTCAEAMRIIEMVGAPNLCLHQDVKAMLGAETEPITEVIAKYAPYVGHFHVNDTNLLGPGMGETDFAPIFDSLLKTGYSGWVSVEVFDYSPGPETIARESLRYMRETLARVESAPRR